MCKYILFKLQIHKCSHVWSLCSHFFTQLPLSLFFVSWTSITCVITYLNIKLYKTSKHNCIQNSIKEICKLQFYKLFRTQNKVLNTEKMATIVNQSLINVSAKLHFWQQKLHDWYHIKIFLQLILLISPI